MTEFNPEYSSQNWTCTKCNEENGEYNGYCEYCFYDYSIYIYNPDPYYIREIRISHISEDKVNNENLSPEEFEKVIDLNDKLTPQEKLFSKLFYHEAHLVKDMELLELRAHREELAKIAFEARARLTAADSEENTRKKKSSDGKPTGFERSLNTDETTTNAINAIKDRQKRMSKQEKIQAGLEKLGISSTDAAKLMSAGTILGRIKNKASEDTKISEQSELKPIFNPFEKK